MKTQLLFISLWVLSISLTWAQGTSYFFQSKGFEKKGMTEYLEVTNYELVLYWSNFNKKPIKLQVKSAKTVSSSHKITQKFEVSFPGSTLKYQLIHTIHLPKPGNEHFMPAGELICRHPNGRVQRFTASPKTYFCKDFENKGVTEFLEMSKDQQTFWYYTSQRPQHRIKLIRLPQKTPGPLRCRFPGQTAVYTITTTMSCAGGYFCYHPDGRVQRFNIYHGHDKLE